MFNPQWWRVSLGRRYDTHNSDYFITLYNNYCNAATAAGRLTALAEEGPPCDTHRILNNNIKRVVTYDCRQAQSILGVPVRPAYDSRQF